MPAAIIADTITILSNAWNDTRSFNSPNDSNQRNAATTGYRFAMIAGKSVAFPGRAGGLGTGAPTAASTTSCACWRIGAAQTANYRGSMVSLYTARQGIGIYKFERERVRAGHPRLRVRHRLPDAGAAATGHADVPGHQHAEVPPDSPPEPIARVFGSAFPSCRILVSHQAAAGGDMALYAFDGTGNQDADDTEAGRQQPAALLSRLSGSRQGPAGNQRPRQPLSRRASGGARRPTPDRSYRRRSASEAISASAS